MMRRGMQGLAQALLMPINTAVVVILGFFTSIWGLWIFSPLWNAFDGATVYANMAFLPEMIWGGIGLLTGIMMIYGVFRNSFRSLTFGAKIGFYHWITVGILLLLGNWQCTLGPLAIMLAVYCSFVWLNIKVNRHNIPFN